MGMAAMAAPNTCSPATAAEVANEFLNLAESEGRGVDQMKLQKLLFYAHAWHLAINDAPLFDNDIECWPWGPVVREIYVQTADCGRRNVVDRTSDFGRLGSGEFGRRVPSGVGDNSKAFIREVWDVHKNMSGVQLSNSTHTDGEPWTIIANEFGTATKPTIPNDLIKDVFKKKLVR